jgi:2'-5' RNA ligase
MKYVVVYLIKGEAKKYHENIARNLSKRFGFKCETDHIMPHITLKYFNPPFGTKKDIADVEKAIGELCKTQKKSSLKLSSFGNFGQNVVFIKVKPSKEMQATFDNLILELKKIKSVVWNQFDGKNMTFHSTLSTQFCQKDFPDIMKYLETVEKPDFNLNFDNVTILQKRKTNWKIYKEFKLK